MVKRYIKNNLIALDQLANAILGGDPDETISSRLEKAHRGDFGPTAHYFSIVPRILVNVIFYPIDGPNHCKLALEEDEGTKDVLNQL